MSALQDYLKGKSLLLAVAVAGCDGEPANTLSASAPATPGPTPAPKAEKKAEVKKVVLTPNIVLEIEGKKRRVLVGASICLQKGPLEQLLTRKNTKEHEAVLSADIDARDLHKALLLTGARVGAPVKFDPKYKAASDQQLETSPANLTTALGLVGCVHNSRDALAAERAQRPAPRDARIATTARWPGSLQRMVQFFVAEQRSGPTPRRESLQKPLFVRQRESHLL